MVPPSSTFALGQYPIPSLNTFVLLVFAKGASWTSCPREIQDYVLSFLYITHILMLGATSHRNYVRAKDHIRARVHNLLRDWGLPPSFLEFMETYNIIFSGSAILALLMPDCLVPNDLDVYIPLGNLPTVLHFISVNTAYQLWSRTRPIVQDATDAYVSDGTANTGMSGSCGMVASLTSSRGQNRAVLSPCTISQGPEHHRVHRPCPAHGHFQISFHLCHELPHVKLARCRLPQNDDGSRRLSERLDADPFFPSHPMLAEIWGPRLQVTESSLRLDTTTSQLFLLSLLRSLRPRSW
jgi:hypothetical protein